MDNYEDIDPILNDELLTQPIPEWMDGVETWVGYLNGTEARRLLLRNILPQAGKEGSNRKPGKARIEEFARVMLEGGWLFTHQGLAFNIQGDCTDGGHRLMALDLASQTNPDIEIPISITIGLPMNANDAIDLVRTRTISDALAMRGKANTMHLAASSVIVWRYQNADFGPGSWQADHWATAKPRRAEQLQWIQDNYDALIAAVRLGSRVKHVFSMSAAGAAVYIIREKYPDLDLEPFIAGIQSGADLSPGNPILAIRNWALNQKSYGADVHGFEHVAIIFKGFTAWRLGKEMKMAVWRRQAEGMVQP